VLDEKLDDLRPRMHEADARFHAAVQKKREVEGVTPDEPALLQDVAGDVLRDLFDVKVLDPAMGSGHFLVEGVDYVTDRLVRYLDGFPFLATFFEGMRGSILAEMERQEVTVDPGQLTDVTLLKRHVLKRCIYGVDLNPMAVELAKVSLWLDCFTLGAPLSFLDHHLRCGNSLIGAMAREVEEEMSGPTPAGQMTFLTGPFTGLLRAADIMRGISGIADVTLEQVRESRHLFDDFDRAAKPYKQLLDVHVAQHFGVERAAEFLEVHTHDPNQALEIVQADLKDIDAPYRETIRQARKLYDDKRFFHWDLEFPEVFIDLEHAAWKRKGGFDAVIGNPPYVRVQRLEHRDTDYLFAKFETCSRKIDVSLAFLETGLNLIMEDGLAAFISSSQWISTDYGQDARVFFGRGKIKAIVDFGSLPIFEDVSTYPAIFILSPRQQKTLLYSEVSDSGYLSLGRLEGLGFTERDYEYLSKESWILKGMNLRARLSEGSLTTPLSQFGHFYIGALTGSDEVFVVSDETVKQHSLEPDLLLPYAYRGEEIEKYAVVSPKMRIIYPYRPNNDGESVLISEEELAISHPNIYAYFLDYKDTLADRRDSRRYYAQGEDWYQFLRPGRYDYIVPRKLIIQGVAQHSCVGLLKGDTAFNGANCPAFIYDQGQEDTNLHYLLSVLNSHLVSEYLLQVCPAKLHGYARFNAGNLNQLPIRRIHFTTPGAERQRRVAGLVALYEQEVTGTSEVPVALEPLLSEIEALLPQNAAGEFLAFQPGATGEEEHSDVVHDLLAHLAEEMIAMHEEKQARVEAFWSDLKAVTDPAAFDDLRNRGKWEQSLGRDPVCRPYVDPESRSTRHLDESLGWDAACYEAFAGMLVGRTSVTPAMVEVYRAHHAGYKALVERIEATDRLIDQVVYRLYGLTEEEVAVVEGE
jgi:hypothetical protein